MVTINEEIREKIKKKRKGNINAQKISGNIIALVGNEEASTLDPTDFDAMTRDIINKTNTRTPYSIYTHRISSIEIGRKRENI